MRTLGKRVAIVRLPSGSNPDLSAVSSFKAKTFQPNGKGFGRSRKETRTLTRLRPRKCPLTAGKSRQTIMNIHDAWEKALTRTEILRSRMQGLATFSDTHVPYIMLSESSVHLNDTVVRRGEVVVRRPSIILPPNIPQFEGFEFEGEKVFDTEDMINFLLVRGITMPSLQYDNKTFFLDIFEGKTTKATDHFLDQLQKAEDVHTGLILGPEDCWQFSLLIFICGQVAKNADMDIKRFLDNYRKKGFER